ncbi:MAG: isopenicillin N synthase family oxygenase [SAR324 cluster bacterium]|nr:isopenicillin N synthase family oxygenase [SAR324 cluster bacterium]
MMLKSGQFDSVPIINIAPLYNEKSDLDGLARAIEHAYSNVGFAYIVNHQIPQVLIDELFEASAMFHALPRAEKMRIEINKFHRGFIPINSSTPKTSSIAEVTKPNQSESFIMMHELPADDPDLLAGVDLAGPNQWPEQLPDFRKKVLAYNSALSELAQKIVRAIALALGQDDDCFDSHFQHPTSFLRLLFYPPHPPECTDELFGSAPHSDYGFITILAQDKSGGLQVRNVSGEWIDAPFIPGTFVMNAGDILHRWSNGHFISTPHRVINRSGHSRYSCPFFFDPNMKSEIVPLATCVGEERPLRYPPVVYGDYLMERLLANHDQHAQRNCST